MSKYDKERQSLGVPTLGPSGANTDKTSKYAKEREAILSGETPTSPQTNVPPPLPLKPNSISVQDKFMPFQPNIYDERLSTLAPSRQIDYQDISKSLESGVASGLPGLLSPSLPLKRTGYYEEMMQNIRDENYQPQTGLGKAAKVIGREGGNLPLWVTGEMAVAKGATKLAPQLGKVGQKLQSLPKAIRGGGLDAATYGGVVAPAETLMEGGGLRDLAEKEKFAPLVGAGGALLRGVAGSLSKARKKPKIEPSELKPLSQEQLAKTEFSLDDLPKLEKKPFKIDGKPVYLNDQIAGKATQNTDTINKFADDFRLKIDRKPVEKKMFVEAVKNARSQFVDDVAPLEKLEKSVTGKVASAEDSIYKQARLFRGSPEKANQIVTNRLQPIIKNIENKGYDYKDLGDYALAVHARDVNKKGVLSGFTDDEIKGVISKFGTPEMEAARKQLIQVSDDLLKDLADAGVISKETVAALRQKWPNYMPLFRAFDDEKIEFTRGISKALANVSSPIQKLEGSKRAVIDPIENMVKNIFKATNAADRNKVAAKLSNLADLDQNSQFVRRLAKEELKERLNTVYALENGEKVYYEVQPDVYKALLNLDKESSNLLIKILQKPASVLRAGATLTPEFSFRNPVRDIVQAYVVSKSGFNPIRDIPGAMKDMFLSKAFKKESMYDNFIKNLGGFGNIVSMDRKAHQDAIEKIVTQPAGKNVVNVLSGKSLIKLLRNIADVSETATKLGEYKAAIRSGASGPEAAYRARDLMDFARAGASVREANKIVAFLNANIQGKSKLIRAIKENPIGVTTRAVQAVTLPSVGVFMAQKYLANEEQKRIIEDAPSWLRNTFWLVPIPNTNFVARIPKPFDLAPVFSNLPERFMEYVYDKDPTAFDGFAKATLSEMSIPVMMTGMLPLIEGMANYSFFRQGSIIPQREQNLQFPDQYDINTTETAKFLGKGVNTLTGGRGPFKNFGSPRIIDNTISGMTAGLGRYATSAIDLIVENTGLAEKETKPVKGITQKPLLRSFLVNDMSSGKAMDELYTLKEQLTKQKGSAKLRGSSFTRAEFTQLKYADKATDLISKINKKMREIENNKTLSKEVKREQLLELNRMRNDLAAEAMERINQTE